MHCPFCGHFILVAKWAGFKWQRKRVPILRPPEDPGKVRIFSEIGFCCPGCGFQVDIKGWKDDEYHILEDDEEQVDEK